ncbi:DNA-binding anti-repressor SinI [Domibacillus sp.]|nr:DNA-binding anti-repressor SinI [Domibacillus sp.]
MERLDIRTDVEDEWVGLMWEAKQLGLSIQEIRKFLQAAQQQETKES